MAAVGVPNVNIASVLNGPDVAVKRLRREVVANLSVALLQQNATSFSSLVRLGLNDNGSACGYIRNGEALLVLALLDNVYAGALAFSKLTKSS